MFVKQQLTQTQRATCMDTGVRTPIGIIFWVCVSILQSTTGKWWTINDQCGVIECSRTQQQTQTQKDKRVVHWANTGHQ